MKILGFEIHRQKSMLQEQRATSGSGVFTASMPTSPVIAALNTLLSDRNHTRSPRELIELYELMYYVFPFFATAMDIRANFVGCPEFTGEDEILAKELNDMAEEFPIYKVGCAYQDDAGLENYARRLFIENLKYGASFSELNRAENSMEVTGVTLAPSSMFNFQIAQNMKWMLTFQGSSGQVWLPDLFDIAMLMTDPTVKHPWGNAMGTYGEYMMAKAVRFIEAEMNFRERVGNPTIMTIFSPDASIYEQESIVKPQDIKDSLAELEKFRDALSDAHRKRLSTGKPSDITAINKVPVKADQYTHGQGISGAGEFSSIYEIMLGQLQLITKVPSTFLGISTSAGIGSDKFRIEKQFLEAQAGADRDKLENAIYKLTDNWLIGMKVNPKFLTSYDIEWSTPNVDDAKLKADTDLVSAQAVQAQLMNLSTILTEFDSDRANQYAESIGKPEWNSEDGAGLGL